jgi:hypothetical protein
MIIFYYEESSVFVIVCFFIYKLPYSNRSLIGANKMSNSKRDMRKNCHSDNKASSSYMIEDHKDCLLI